MTFCPTTNDDDADIPQAVHSILDLQKRHFSDGDEFVCFSRDVLSNIALAILQQEGQVEIGGLLHHARTQCQDLKPGRGVSEKVQEAINEIRNLNHLHYERMMVSSIIAIRIVAQGGMYRLSGPSETTESVAPFYGGVWVPLEQILSKNDCLERADLVVITSAVKERTR